MRGYQNRKKKELINFLSVGSAEKCVATPNLKKIEGREARVAKLGAKKKLKIKKMKKKKGE